MIRKLVWPAMMASICLAAAACGGGGGGKPVEATPSSTVVRLPDMQSLPDVMDLCEIDYVNAPCVVEAQSHEGFDFYVIHLANGAEWFNAPCPTEDSPACVREQQDGIRPTTYRLHKP